MIFYVPKLYLRKIIENNNTALGRTQLGVLKRSDICFKAMRKDAQTLVLGDVKNVQAVTNRLTAIKYSLREVVYIQESQVGL